MIWNPMMMAKMNISKVMMGSWSSMVMTMEQTNLPMDGIVRSNETINSSTPMEKAFAQLVTTM
jgi:hypothetical protein